MSLRQLRLKRIKRRIAIANSIPKSGTYLLVSLLRLLGFEDSRKHLVPSGHWSHNGVPRHHVGPVKDAVKLLTPGEVAAAHLTPGTIDSSTVSHFFIHRNPRDVVVSYVNFVLAAGPTIPLEEVAFYRKLSYESMLIAAIRGEPYPSPLAWFDTQRGWMLDPHTVVVRFADLIGSNGGGEREIQEATVQRVAASMEVDVNVGSICDAIHGYPSHTFFRGVVGQWRDVFTERVQDEFDKRNLDLGFWGY